MFFWLKASYLLTDKRLTGTEPNVILGFVPLGEEQVNQPLKTIASVNSGTKFLFKKFIVGMVLAIIGFTVFSKTIVAGIILLFLV